MSTALDPAARWRMVYRRPQARLRLYCFPFAGAGASAYRYWPGMLPERVELRAVQLPGRQNRRMEPARASCRELVAELADVLGPELDAAPFAFFGHSMGALVAFELTRELRRRRGVLPVRLAVSGCAAPHVPMHRAPVHQLPEDRLVAEVRRLGGTPAAFLADPALRKLALPALRADLALCHSYAHQTEPPLDCPVSAFGGRTDPLVSATDLDAWQRHTRFPITVRRYSGGHFYLDRNLGTVVSALTQDLA
jgi:surfactin synthase thioesterase subunit